MKIFIIIMIVFVLGYEAGYIQRQIETYPIAPQKDKPSKPAVLPHQ
jgi:hypothetical protein